MSGRRKISPPVRSDPGDVRVLADERDDFVGRQLVGRLALPDVARLAPVLAPVGQAEIELQRRGGTVRGRPQERHAEVSRAPELCQESIRRHGYRAVFLMIRGRRYHRSPGSSAEAGRLLGFGLGFDPVDGPGLLRVPSCDPHRDHELGGGGAPPPSSPSPASYRTSAGRHRPRPRSIRSKSSLSPTVHLSDL